MTIRDFRHSAIGQWGVWLSLVLIGNQEYIGYLITWSIVIVAVTVYETWQNNAEKRKNDA